MDIDLSALNVKDWFQPLFFTEGECGVSKYDDAATPSGGNVDIVGGKEARPNEFPHQVRNLSNELCNLHIVIYS